MHDRQDNLLPLTSIQRLIGKYMLESKRNKPCAYIECHADLTELVKMRKKYCRAIGVRASTNDFFITAIARAIAKYPLMAGKITPDGEHIEISKQIGVGFAVAAPQGLVVPVVKDASSKDLPAIAIESNELLQKARANKLMPDDFDGDNIVLSGLGMFNISSFMAISPPQPAGIIAMARIEDTVIPIDGEMLSRKMMSLMLAADQRLVNPFYAARFLKYVVHQLENPKTLTGDFS